MNKIIVHIVDKDIKVKFQEFLFKLDFSWINRQKKLKYMDKDYYLIDTMLNRIYWNTEEQVARKVKKNDLYSNKIFKLNRIIS